VRLFKWVSLGLGALVTLVVLGVLVVVWLVDPNSFRSNIEAAVRDNTGREFKLVGDIDLDFFPWLALHTGKGSFGNAPGFGTDPMVTWESAQLGVKLFPLIRGKLIADRISLEGADVKLVRRADGVGNWQGLRGTKPVDPDAEPLELNIDGIDIEDSRLSFVDETVPRRIGIEKFNLTTGEISSGDPFTDTEIDGVLHMDGFAPEGVPFRVAVPKVVLPEDFSTVEVKEFAVTFGGFEVEGAVAGSLGETPKLAGSLESNEFDPRALLASVGIAPPKTTDAEALGKLRFTGSWTLDGGAVGVDPFTLQLDDTHFKGSFHRSAGDNPVGQFALRGDTLNISRYVPPTDPASEPFVLPTAMLKALMFRGSVELEQAKLGDIDMKGVTLRLLLDEQGLRSEAKAPEGARPGAGR
jgi:AsmA protein